MDITPLLASICKRACDLLRRYLAARWLVAWICLNAVFAFCRVVFEWSLRLDHSSGKTLTWETGPARSSFTVRGGCVLTRWVEMSNTMVLRTWEAVDVLRYRSPEQSARAGRSKTGLGQVDNRRWGPSSCAPKLTLQPPHVLIPARAPDPVKQDAAPSLALHKIQSLRMDRGEALSRQLCPDPSHERSSTRPNNITLLPQGP